MSRIAHFNTYPHGGAAVAALRMSREMNRVGEDSTFYWSHANREFEDCRAVRELPVVDSRNRSLGSLFSKPFRKMRRRSIQAAWEKEIAPRDTSLEVFSLAEQFHPLKPDWGSIRADLVQLHWIAFMADWPTFFLAIPDHVPIVWTLHDMNPFSGGCHYSGGCNRFESGCGSCPQLARSSPIDVSSRSLVAKRKALQGKQLHVVSPSNWLAKLAIQSPVWPDGTTFSVIRYGLPLDVFFPMDRTACKQEFGIAPDQTVIGFGAESIGNRRKGFSQLLNALGRLESAGDRPPLTVLLMGDVKSGSFVEELPGINQTIRLGYVPKEQEQARFYSACDVVVVPSLEDNQPQMALEAMACGTPVVAFETGGIAEFVQDGITGRLATVGDSAELANSLLDLVRDPELRKLLGHRSRMLITREFELVQQTAKYRELYNGMLSPGRRYAA